MKSATRDEIQLDAADILAARRLAPRYVIPPARPVWKAEAISPVFQVVVGNHGTYANYEGGDGYVRDPKSELFLLAASNMVGQNTFYEQADARDHRYRQLVRELALSDPEWTLGLLRWLRTEAHMRTASLVGAAEFAKARQEAGRHGYSRQAVAAVLQRPDEPGELLAYWTTRYGRRLPMPVKRGVADAVQRLYTGRALLKYDTDSAAFRFGDVIELTHPTPAPDRPWQAVVFRYALDRRHHPATAMPPAETDANADSGANTGAEANTDADANAETAAMLRAHHTLRSLPLADRRAAVTAEGAAERFAAAGMTWEALAGWLHGPLDAAAWEAVIPSMGAMALVRNLRNFDRAGISDAVADEVARRISDRDEVIRSRQFPFRFLAAYRQTSQPYTSRAFEPRLTHRLSGHRPSPSERWGRALEAALTHSLANVPALPGRTLVLVDRSGSMFYASESGTDLTRADSAAIFGTALALRGEHVDLVQFGTGSRPVAVRDGDSVLAALDRFGGLGGTETAAAIRNHYRGHDRVVIITDEQAYQSDGSVFAPIPAEVPVYTWNLEGYALGHAAPGPRRYTFGGLSDAAFRLIPFIEQGLGGGWPWDHEERQEHEA